MDAEDRAWWERYRRQRKRELWASLAWMVGMVAMVAVITVSLGPGLWYVLQHLSVSVRWSP